MPENKTRPTDDSVPAFLAAVADPQRRADAEELCALMTDITGTPATMWGSGIVGFGSYHYRYATGREGDAPVVGFSPRKQALTLYVTLDAALLARLGPHTTGTGCLYLKRLSDVDQEVLRELIRNAFNARDGETLE